MPTPLKRVITGSPMHPHKIVFYARDVKKLRATLIQRGATMGKVYTYKQLAFCDGKDPEGHVFRISNR